MNKDIPVAAPIIGQLEIEYVTDAVRSGWVSSIGPYIQRFEQEFARYIGVRHAVAVTNGTAALHLSLHALGIGPGDEVILPDLTFAATAHAVLQVGADPVFADVDPISWCMDPTAVQHAVTSRTKAIMPVHLYGQPANMTVLGDIARGVGAILIEDAAEAHGGSWGGRKVGGFGKVGTFSFYGNKIITTGEGGMVTTDDDELVERLRFLKDHGMAKWRRYFHSELAFNYRITNLQAALGVAQLQQIEEFIQRKRRVHQWYSERLRDCPILELQEETPGSRNVFWMTSVLLPKGHGAARDLIVLRLAEKGIDTRPLFVPMSELPHLRRFRAVGRSSPGCPVASSLSGRGLNLPSGCSLDREDVDRVATELVDAVSLQRL